MMTREEIELLDGEALAAAVAVGVTGWHKTTVFGGSFLWEGPKTDGIKPVECWRPDQNISQAFEVMRARPEWRWTIGEWEDGRVRAYLPHPTDLHAEGFCAWVPAQHGTDWTRAWCVAICRASLMAVEVTE